MVERRACAASGSCEEDGDCTELANPGLGEMAGDVACETGCCGSDGSASGLYQLSVWVIVTMKWRKHRTRLQRLRGQQCFAEAEGGRYFCPGDERCWWAIMWNPWCVVNCRGLVHWITISLLCACIPMFERCAYLHVQARRGVTCIRASELTSSSKQQAPPAEVFAGMPQHQWARSASSSIFSRGEAQGAPVTQFTTHTHPDS